MAICSTHKDKIVYSILRIIKAGATELIDSILIKSATINKKLDIMFQSHAQFTNLLLY
jgi:hypothetical protein